jgi:hypothetical protein
MSCDRASCERFWADAIQALKRHLEADGDQETTSAASQRAEDEAAANSKSITNDPRKGGTQ